MDSIAYFDNAATTFPKPEEVYQFVDRFYRTCGVNVGRGQHKLASQAAKLVQDTRTALPWTKVANTVCRCRNGI